MKLKGRDEQTVPMARGLAVEKMAPYRNYQDRGLSLEFVVASIVSSVREGLSQAGYSYTVLSVDEVKVIVMQEMRREWSQPIKSKKPLLVALAAMVIADLVAIASGLYLMHQHEIGILVTLVLVSIAANLLTFFLVRRAWR